MYPLLILQEKMKVANIVSYTHTLHMLQHLPPLIRCFNILEFLRSSDQYHAHRAQRFQRRSYGNENTSLLLLLRCIFIYFRVKFVDKVFFWKSSYIVIKVFVCLFLLLLLLFLLSFSMLWLPIKLLQIKTFVVVVLLSG